MRSKRFGLLICILHFAICNLHSHALEAFQFSYRLDSWQNFNQPGYLAKTFRRNQEFAVEGMPIDTMALRMAYHFTADVDGPTAIHQWNPVTAVMQTPLLGHWDAGIAAPYTSALGTVGIIWTDRPIYMGTDWEWSARIGNRLNDGTWIVQPVGRWYFLPHLMVSINDGRMVEYLLHQEPKAELCFYANKLPLQTSLQWIDDRISWELTLRERWDL